MAKLHQILAIEPDVQRQALDELKRAAEMLGNKGLLNGLTQVYRPRAVEEGRPDAGERTEHVGVRANGEELLAAVLGKQSRLLDVTASRDYTNCVARADIVVGDAVLVKDVPATYLLWLERHALPSLERFVRALPLLDQAENWKPDEGDVRGVYRTEEQHTDRTKKVPARFVKYDATPVHPAQVEFFYADEVEGVTSRTKRSGAFPPSRVQELLARIWTLQEAVKDARSRANGAEAEEPRPGSALIGYLLG